jgi:hypothetical protein
MFISGILSLFLLSCVSDPLVDLRERFPDPGLSAPEVVEIQLRALQFNNPDDDGIEIVYRFAAPSNKLATGPLARFSRLFLSPQYAPMINSEEVELLDFRAQDDIALQGSRVVGEDGNEYFYLFILQKQGAGNYEDCWMTIGVQVYSGIFPSPDFSVDSQSI